MGTLGELMAPDMCRDDGDELVETGDMAGHGGGHRGVYSSPGRPGQAGDIPQGVPGEGTVWGVVFPRLTYFSRERVELSIRAFTIPMR